MRSMVWGDGSDGSIAMDAPKNQSASLSIFGNLP
jgi:hypothetical protein